MRGKDLKEKLKQHLSNESYLRRFKNWLYPQQDLLHGIKQVIENLPSGELDTPDYLKVLEQLNLLKNNERLNTKEIAILQTINEEKESESKIINEFEWLEDLYTNHSQQLTEAISQLEMTSTEKSSVQLQKLKEDKKLLESFLQEITSSDESDALLSLSTKKKLFKLLTNTYSYLAATDKNTEACNKLLELIHQCNMRTTKLITPEKSFTESNLIVKKLMLLNDAQLIPHFIYVLRIFTLFAQKNIHTAPIHLPIHFNDLTKAASANTNPSDIKDTNWYYDKKYVTLHEMAYEMAEKIVASPVELNQFCTALNIMSSKLSSSTSDAIKNALTDWSNVANNKKSTSQILIIPQSSSNKTDSLHNKLTTALAQFHRDENNAYCFLGKLRAKIKPYVIADGRGNFFEQLNLFLEKGEKPTENDIEALKKAARIAFDEKIAYEIGKNGRAYTHEELKPTYHRYRTLLNNVFDALKIEKPKIDASSQEVQNKKNNFTTFNSYSPREIVLPYYEKSPTNQTAPFVKKS